MPFSVGLNHTEDKSEGLDAVKLIQSPLEFVTDRSYAVLKIGKNE